MLQTEFEAIVVGSRSQFFCVKRRSVCSRGSCSSWRGKRVEGSGRT